MEFEARACYLNPVSTTLAAGQIALQLKQLGGPWIVRLIDGRERVSFKQA